MPPYLVFPTCSPNHMIRGISPISYEVHIREHIMVQCVGWRRNRSQDYRNNNEWNRCIDENSITWGRCIYDCDGNEQCEDQCVLDFKLTQKNCPCEVFYARLHQCF